MTPIEVLEIVRLNKSWPSTTPIEVEKLPKDTWHRQIPKRPDFPPGYFDVPGLIEEETEEMEEGQAATAG